jgi:uncharacterized membrane protein YdjX (TVP38/TMEM64 family)
MIEEDSSENKTITDKKGVRVQKGFKYLKIVLFLAIIAGIPIAIFISYPDFGRMLTDRDALTEFLAAIEEQNIIIYIILVIVVAITGLPIGQVINFAGGLIFGTALAFGLSIGATAIATFIAFHVARHFGKEFVILIFKEKNVNKFVDLMDSSKAYVAIVLIYLIPGFPKDAFTYAAGLSHLRALPFTLTAAVARSPGMLATLLFAGFIRDSNYIGAGIVVAVIGAFLIFVIIKRKAVFAYIESLHTKVKR